MTLCHSGDLSPPSIEYLHFFLSISFGNKDSPFSEKISMRFAQLFWSFTRIEKLRDVYSKIGIFGVGRMDSTNESHDLKDWRF